jgi:hypothetical protein
VSLILVKCTEGWSWPICVPLQKPLITNKMHKEFFLSCNTLLHVSTLLGHLQGEIFAVVTLRLHFIVELLTVVLQVQAETTDSSRLQKQRSTQSTAQL